MAKQFCSLATLGLTALTFAGQSGSSQGTKDLGNMSIEDLMKVQVTTASKEAQSYLNVPAAIYVVTQDQIHRSGATSIPDALRIVPGVQVAQLSAEEWQISIRGFSDEYADKLLVMIDGRSVYNSTFSGVYWDTQEIGMADIERIEVIRGPGGSLWGTNAVNGVINVITKKASETQGGSVSMTTSTTSAYETEMRYGGRLGKNGFYRVYGKALSQYSLNTDFGPSANDSWQDLRGGFRADWTDHRDSFLLSGGLNSEHLGVDRILPTFTAPYSRLAQSRYPAADTNLVGRWLRTDGPGKGTTLQVSYTQEDRDDPGIGEAHTTLTADFQAPLQLSPTNRLTLGAGYRYTRDAFVPGDFANLSQLNVVAGTLSSFVHDEWKIRPNLILAAGVKAENNKYVGWQLQPSASLAWNPGRQQTLWAAVSRAVRTPNSADEFATLPINVTPTPYGPAATTLEGTATFQPEIELANEVGWRFAPTEHLLVDATAFYNQYTQLQSYSPGTPVLSNGVITNPEYFANALSAVTAGFELATRYAITSTWQVEATYSLFSDHYYFPGGVVDFSGVTGVLREGSTPHNQVGFRSSLNLPNRLDCDGAVYYVQGTPVGPIAAYARVDLRFGWHPSASTEISLGGQNLFSDQHHEALTSFTVPDSIPRNFYLKVNFKF